MVDQIDRVFHEESIGFDDRGRADRSEEESFAFSIVRPPQRHGSGG